jgi:hypothetical protein
MGKVQPMEIVYDAVERVLDKDEAWRVIENMSGLTGGKVKEITLLNPGRHFKQSFLVVIGNENQDAWTVAKAFKRFTPQRFIRELEPREDQEFMGMTPRLIGTSESINRTRLNEPMKYGDHQILIEEFVLGKDLNDLRDDSAFPIYRERCRERYRLACSILHRRQGRVLTNINPKNILIPHDDPANPVIVDWAAQENSPLSASEALIRKNLQ